jgi:two-component system, NtrC family, response regulator PilR
MVKKTILLIEDDPKTEAAIKEVIGREYNLKVVKDQVEATLFIANRLPDLMLIDFDIKSKDGLQIYREMRPNIKVIMLSISGNVPLAVSATKQGVVDFLRKPINAEELLEAIERNLGDNEVRLFWPDSASWLRGESKSIKKMLSNILGLVKEGSDMVLFGEGGIPKEDVAEFIHANGPNRAKKMVRLDLSSFAKEHLEGHFWGSIKKILSLPETNSLQRVNDLCGTLYLENFGQLDEHFKLSILDYFRGSNKNILVIFATADKEIDIDGYPIISIPALRERKEDLPYLLDLYLSRYSIKYNKKVQSISSDILAFLASYDFPGNYAELEIIIEEAVLSAQGECLERINFPFDLNSLIQSSQLKASAENLPLHEARRDFEKGLYKVLLDKSNDDEPAVARFMDLPKNVLLERLENLFD